MTATLDRKQHDARVLRTLGRLAETDDQLVETLKVVGVGFAALIVRVAALEKASEEQRNLLAGAVEMVNAMRGVLDLLGGGIATLERRIDALEQTMSLSTTNGEQPLHKRGFDS